MERPEIKSVLKSLIYGLLRERTGQDLPWGDLTGIRPVKIAMNLLNQGKSNAEIARYMRERYHVSIPKSALTVRIANQEKYLLDQFDYKNGYSLYIGIPFCPSICLYCSFSSSPLALWKGEVDAYLDALEKEMEASASLFEGKELQSIYIGGGTPTTLEPEQMDRLLTMTERCFDLSRVREFTVEAGRPDSITADKLRVLRDKKTGTKEFREVVEEVCVYMCYRALEDAELNEVEIETPITKMVTGELDENRYAFVPILRAGMGMLGGLTQVIPNAKIGHIGMYRDEKNGNKPVNYFFKVPSDIEHRTVILLDPMLATGGSAVDAIDMLKEKGVKSIKFLCVIAAPEGLKVVTEAHPDVPIYCGAIDDHLNERAYIVPGLGDAGDRIYGTK